MVNSMTAFATQTGGADALSWAWEIRSVNGRGLDIRLRLPDGLEALDQPARKALGSVAKRGTINVTLKLRRAVGETAAALNPDGLNAALEAAAEIAEVARARGLEPAPVEIAGLMALPSVYGRSDAQDDAADHIPGMLQSMRDAVDAFAAARRTEGDALQAILNGQIDAIAALIAEARAVLPERKAAASEAMRANVAKLLDTTDVVDEARLAQELALIAVKSDVAEEVDRLDAHVAAARELLAAKGPIGRKFDFLTQEFNREANTLCSKAGYEALTRIGLDLKTVIDQMREQVQNVE